MLRAGRETQHLRRIWREGHDPVAEPKGIEQLSRLRRAIDDFGVWIGRVEFIKTPNRFAETRRVGNVGEERFVVAHAWLRNFASRYLLSTLSPTTALISLTTPSTCA